MSAVPAERSREPGGVEVAAAYAHCARVARTHYGNFTIGSWLLPRRLRQDLAAVYAFARGADDIADEGEATGRLERLQAWEAKLLACARDPGAAGDPVFLALGHTIAARALPLEPFPDLLGYCRCSANPVGRLVLALFGHRDAARQSRADDICTALQLTNFWQDVAGDLDCGRVYLPEEDLARCPGSHEALATRRVNAG